jgi:hypothetical protein
MADKSLSIQLKVSADGLVEGLKIAGQSVEGASQAFRTHFGKAGESASGLTAVLREFKGEATQAGRVAGFYARDLAEIIPGANGASGAIKQVFGALLSGSAAGAAIELVIAGLAQVNEHLQEEEKLQRAVRNAGIDAAFSINSEIRKLNDSLDGTLTKTAALKRNLGDGIRSAAKEAMKASADAITDDESFWGKIKGTAKGIASQLFPNLLGDLGPEASKKIGDAYVVVNKVIEEQEKHATEIAKAEGREQAKGFYDAANETVAIETKTKDRIFQLRAQLKIETDKLATDAILGDQKNADLRLARVKALKAAERLEERKVIEQEEGFKVKSEADADKQVFDYFQEKQEGKAARLHGDAAKDRGGREEDCARHRPAPRERLFLCLPRHHRWHQGFHHQHEGPGRRPLQCRARRWPQDGGAVVGGQDRGTDRRQGPEPVGDPREHCDGCGRRRGVAGLHSLRRSRPGRRGGGRDDGIPRISHHAALERGGWSRPRPL